jgi:hypothetical protein
MRCGRTTIAGAALAAGLAAPPPASAAQIQIASRCAPANTELKITGSGFSPGALVKITGIDTASDYALADDAGAFSETFLTPPIDDYRAHPTTVTATDADNPALKASAPLSLVQELFLTNVPFAGRPTQRVRWLFAGFLPGKTIYGHFVYRSKVRRTYRFGVAAGACGTLSVMAPRFPTRARRGRWYVQFDQVKAYSRATKPRRETHVTIS